MSFSVGPFVGKRDPVIKAVKEAPVHGSAQGEAAKALLVSELEQLPADARCCIARAYGHADPGQRNLCVEVNQLSYSSGIYPGCYVE